jgi:diacylglycerol kinase family enzyme
MVDDLPRPAPRSRRALLGSGLAALAAVGAVAARRRHVSEARVVELEGVTESPGLGPVALVVNPGGGSADGVDLDGVRVRELADGEDLVEVLGSLADEVAVIGVAGGDGSVGCAAQVACDRDRVLWVVPGGTLNHFARDLGLRTPDDAQESLAAGRTAEVDMGEAAGVGFVNNASLGVYGELVRRREAMEHRLPKRLALLVAAARTLRTAEPLGVQIDGERRRVYLVFAGNNSYTGAGLTARASLQEGCLDVRVLSGEGRLPRTSALWAILTSPHGGSRWLTQTLRSEVTVRLDEPAHLAHDGEVREVSGEVRFRSRPRCLRVLVPAPA